MLRITKPRVEVLDVLHRVGGRIHQPDGRAVPQIAKALGYSGSLTGLKRVLAALEDHGLIVREARDGRVHTLTITEAGEELLRERGLIDSEPRQHLLDEAICNDRQLLVLATAAIAQRLNDWAEEADVTKPSEDLRLESVLALHEDLDPRHPGEDELAVAVARSRVALGNLLDSYLSDPSSVDADQVENAIRALLEARLVLIAWHKELKGSD